MINIFEREDLIEFLESCLMEDVGEGDITTDAILTDGSIGNAKIISKEKGIIAGVKVAEILFGLVDEDLEFISKFKDGDEVNIGDEIIHIHGNIKSILMAERTVLNFMQRMSGIASLTNKYVKEVAGTRAKIYDTRKTVPGLRLLDKYSVKIGGGENHRLGLYDMFLIKENHIASAGSISKAINLCYDYRKDEGLNYKIEIEVTNLEELKEVLDNGKADLILIDNFEIDDMKKAVEIVNNRCEVEASGGITFENLRKIAETGVDRISIGALTHSVKAFDLSLLIDKK
ncbi:MAG TPA: carboxylating nicotinate-nucleotide diphosphorylase [Bacteroidota bacterium]|nr:carboxylating nicotinate-nucleotide diphosphorylase [Bacteroidota bacterium]